MDKLADGLQKLNEDDLLQVVQMVHDNKAPDSYTKNDVESMFHGLFYSNPASSRRASFVGTKPENENENENANVLTDSGRIPRRPIHPPGYFDQDAVGFYSRARRSLSSIGRTVTLRNHHHRHQLRDCLS